jgi:hypothetical protein
MSRVLTACAVAVIVCRAVARRRCTQHLTIAANGGVTSAWCLIPYRVVEVRRVLVFWEGGTPWLLVRKRRWLRRYATSRKVAGASPDQNIDFLFNIPNPSSRAMTLAFTQLLTEM